MSTARDRERLRTALADAFAASPIWDNESRGRVLAELVAAGGLSVVALGNAITRVRRRQDEEATERRRAAQEAERERSCASCGEKFVPWRHDARYCSARCRQRAHRASKAVRPDNPDSTVLST